MNIVLSLYDLWDTGEKRHPQLVMRELGITYQHAVPQSIADCWHFWKCQNVPDPLPVFLREITRPPSDYIGHGLTKEDADRIAADNSPDDPRRD